MVVVLPYPPVVAGKIYGIHIFKRCFLKMRFVSYSEIITSVALTFQCLSHPYSKQSFVSSVIHGWIFWTFNSKDMAKRDFSELLSHTKG